jgi:serine/threonine-protein kinase
VLGEDEIGTSLAALLGCSTIQSDESADRTASLGKSTSLGERFQILRPHARGGLGAVFVARDQELHREVALKQILAEYVDDPISRQRFLLEAEITGGLEHPGIVPVYGLGIDSGGRPFYAMRFIRGDSLKSAIAAYHSDESLKTDPGRRSLALRHLLRRFVDVCHAIDYAHSRGVLHRDLKPANIILGKHGETLVVDWGLAKAVGRTEPRTPLEERTLTPSSGSGPSGTLPGSAMGTPGYMSPEQASGDIDHLGTRSDVYSLGATLYCLLTGRAPFEGADIGSLLRAVQRGEFAPPSSRDKSIDRALESVCLKAMSLEPANRYATPKDLSDDLERWQADEPVAVWREPWLRRVRRWARRNRALVTAAVAAVLVAMAGLAAVLVVQANANRTLADANARLIVANERESRANAELRVANAEVLRQRGLAQRNFRTARQAVDESFTRISESTLLNSPLPGMQPFRKELLESSLKYYQGFLREAGDDAALRSDVAAAYFRTGTILAEMGSLDEAIVKLDVARDIYRKLSLDGDTTRAARLALSECDQRAGVALVDQERYSESIPRLERAIEVQQSLAQETADDPAVLATLALSHNKLGAAKYEANQDEGMQHFRAAARLRERLVVLEPDKAQFRGDLAITLMNLAVARDFRGETAGISESLGQAQADLERVSRQQPENLSFREKLGLVCCNHGRTLAYLGHIPEGLEALARGQEVLSALVRENPTVDLFQTRFTYSSTYFAKWLTAAGRMDDALGVLQAAEALLDAKLKENSNRLDAREALGQTHIQIADALARKGQVGKALEVLERAIAIDEEIVGKVVTSLGNYDLACAYSLKAGLLGRPELRQRSAERIKPVRLALNRLRQIFAMGYRIPHWLETDPQLEAVRGHSDFQALLIDMKFPAQALLSND